MCHSYFSKTNAPCEKKKHKAVEEEEKIVTLKTKATWKLCDELKVLNYPIWSESVRERRKHKPDYDIT